MRTLSVTAFAATLLPSFLIPPALEHRILEPSKAQRIGATELRAAAIAPIAPPDTIVAEVSPPAMISELPPAAPEAARLASAADIDNDLHCLALNIYHEARSEPLSGQVAVAQVTLNRVASNAFPRSVCEVVKQGGPQRNGCQFSWWCDGKSDQPTEPKAWRRSLDLGRRVLAEQVTDPTRGALYYHANYVKPRWARSFQRTTQIGRHLFYKPAHSS